MITFRTFERYLYLVIVLLLRESFSLFPISLLLLHSDSSPSRKGIRTDISLSGCLIASMLALGTRLVARAQSQVLMQLLDELADLSLMTSSTGASVYYLSS